MFLFVRSADVSSPMFLTEDQPDRFLYENILFTEVPIVADAGLFLGFYDWQRTADGRVVGVEIILHDDREAVKKALMQGGLGEWVAPDIVRVLFSRHAEIDPALSVDQEFSVSRCYSGSDGTAALLFDASEIAPGHEDAC